MAAHYLENAFFKVFENALDACKDPITVEVTCWATELGGRPAVGVSLRDSGTGFAPMGWRRHLKPFIPRRSRAPDWGWPSCGASSKPMDDGYVCKTRTKVARSWNSACRETIESLTRPSRSAVCRGLSGGATCQDHPRVTKNKSSFSNLMKTVTTPPSWFSSQGRRSRNDEDELSERFDGRAMAVDSQVATEDGQDRPTACRSTMGHQCDPVSQPHRLPVALLAPRLSQMEDGLHRLLAVAQGRRLGENPRSALSATAPGSRQEADSQRGDHRQPVDTHRGRRRRTRLRCGEKDHRPQATYRRRHVGIDLGRRGAWRVLGKIRRERVS